MLRERVVESGGVPLFLIEAGPEGGPVVILLHGFPEGSYGWRHQVGPLAAAGFRVLVPDGRGYGRSGKPDGIDAYRIARLAADVIAIADAAGADKVRLVGHDWGGIVAWWIAARHPERVERLVVINAPHPDTRWRVALRHPGQLLRSAYVAFFQIPGLPERLLAAHKFAALSRVLVRTSWPETFTADDLAIYREAWSRPGALTGMLNWYRALIRHPPKPAGSVRVPTRILWGKRDTALIPAFAEEAMALCSNVRIIWYDDATHWVQHEEPKAVSAALLDFLKAD